MSAIALLTDHHQYFLYANHTDMRKSFHGLCGIVRNELDREVSDRDIFIFLNKRTKAGLACHRLLPSKGPYI